MQDRVDNLPRQTELKRCIEQLRQNARCFYQQARRFNLFDKLFTSILIFSSIIVLAISATFTANNAEPSINVLYLTIASAITIAMAALQYAWDFREKCNWNKHAGALCATLRREAELLLVNTDAQKDVDQKELAALVQRINDLGASAPLIRARIWKKFEAPSRFSFSNERLLRRSKQFCDGSVFVGVNALFLSVESNNTRSGFLHLAVRRGDRRAGRARLG